MGEKEEEELLLKLEGTEPADGGEGGGRIAFSVGRDRTCRWGRRRRKNCFLSWKGQDLQMGEEEEEEWFLKLEGTGPADG